jgi:hypothetical protein
LKTLFYVHLLPGIQEAGLKDAPSGACIIWGDYDNDGDLDLYAGNGDWDNWWEAGSNIFYRNNGDGTFTDITIEAGLKENASSCTHAGFGD